MKIYRKTIISYLYDHVGEEMTTYQLLEDCYGEETTKCLDSLELMRINARINEIAKTAGINLDSSDYDDMVVGLPYNIHFVIKRIPFGKEKKIRGNKYDAPFMNMDRETAEKIANQNSPAERRMIINGDDYYNKIVREIAEEEVNSMSDEDKEYYLNHPDYNEHHFGYGMYLRNNYIHDKIDVLSPDDMSADIFEEIIKLLNR